MLGYLLRFQPSLEALHLQTLAVKEGPGVVRGGFVRNAGRGRRLGVTMSCPSKISRCLGRRLCEHRTEKSEKL